MIDIKIEYNQVKAGQPASIGVMVEATAPEFQAATSIQRTPRGVVFVVDRSGSMGGGRLELVKQTILEILGRLNKDDYLGVVCFDNNVNVTVPLTRVGNLDLAKVRTDVEALQPGGNTNMEQGYRHGLAEADLAPAGTECTVILLSDGQANNGSINPQEFGQLAAAATERFVTTTAIGIGRNYQESILVQMANSGNGNHLAAYNFEEASVGLHAEIDGLLERTMADLQVRVHGLGPVGASAKIRCVSYFHKNINADSGFTAKFGDLASLEERNYVFEYKTSGYEPQVLGDYGAIQVEVKYTNVLTGEPVVVVRDFAITQVAPEHWVEPARDEDIVMELANLRAQDTKERAIDLARLGRMDEARELLRSSGQELEELEALNVNMSSRNRNRTQAMREEAAMMHFMDAAEFIKRGEESVKRGRESKTDPRNRNRDH